MEFLVQLRRAAVEVVERDLAITLVLVLVSLRFEILISLERFLIECQKVLVLVRFEIGWFWIYDKIIHSWEKKEPF